MSLTRQLREELAHRPVPDARTRRVEASALVRFAGRLRLRGTATGTTIEVVVRCTQGAVARRLRATLLEEYGVRPGLAQRREGNLTGSAGYLVTVDAAAAHQLGVLDADGRPVPLAAADVDPAPTYLAGALMATGTLSGPGTAVDLQIPAPSRATAEVLAAALPGAAAVDERVVVKSGPVASALLASVGATDTAAVFDRSRTERELRRRANRATNADRANLRRATSAAATHIDAIERIVQARGWEGLPDDLRAVALTRVANPALPLSELGDLLDPPAAKATVHRRLKRLLEIAEGLPTG